VAAFTSPAESRTPPPTIALASSAPSHVGRCSSHQHTVRISWTGSRSGSQRGQYDDARLGVSVSSLTREPADDECTPPYRSRAHRQCQIRNGRCVRSLRSVIVVIWTERPNQWTKLVACEAAPTVVGTGSHFEVRGVAAAAEAFRRALGRPASRWFVARAIKPQPEVGLAKRLFAGCGGWICSMLHGARAILGRPPLKARHGLEFPTDPSEFTEFKYAISLRADSIPVSAGMQLTGDAACEFWCGCGGSSRFPRCGVAERHRPDRYLLVDRSK